MLSLPSTVIRRHHPSIATRGIVQITRVLYQLRMIEDPRRRVGLRSVQLDDPRLNGPRPFTLRRLQGRGAPETAGGGPAEHRRAGTFKVPQRQRQPASAATEGRVRRTWRIEACQLRWAHDFGALGVAKRVYCLDQRTSNSKMIPT